MVLPSGPHGVTMGVEVVGVAVVTALESVAVCLACEWTISGGQVTVDRAAERHVKQHHHSVVVRTTPETAPRTAVEGSGRLPVGLRHQAGKQPAPGR